jgi:hypothetical protein
MDEADDDAAGFHGPPNNPEARPPTLVLIDCDPMELLENAFTRVDPKFQARYLLSMSEFCLQPAPPGC